ncbi:MAG: hypothetical protein JW769_04985 [Parachlamydiales bacterium]|nr:hypothetical protein [Parachlamydiales bacterium]
MKHVFALLFFFVAGCGYYSPSSQVSIQVPYIEGDHKGLLTQELIYQLSSSGYFTYSTGRNAYRLDVKLLDKSHNQIGYRHDREKAQKKRKNVVATEGREVLVAEVTLLNADGETLLGPINVSADIDYDYIDQNALADLAFIDSSGQQRSVLSFSLGQLEGIDAAQAAAELPLYHSLAKKIIETLMEQGNRDDLVIF